MVRISGSSEYDRLDALVAEVCGRHGLAYEVAGWTRKTYDVYKRNEHDRTMEHVARVESFATTSGEIRVFDDGTMPFAEDLGAALEKEFGVREAVVIRERRPE